MVFQVNTRFVLDHDKWCGFPFLVCFLGEAWCRLMETKGCNPQPREGAGTCAHPCQNLSSPSKPSTCRSQVQFILHKLIKSNRFVLVSIQMLWVFCHCLSHSACFKEPAAHSQQGQPAPSSCSVPVATGGLPFTPMCPRRDSPDLVLTSWCSSLSRSTLVPFCPHLHWSSHTSHRPA